MNPGEEGLHRTTQKRALSIARLRDQSSLVSLNDETDGQSEPSRLFSKIPVVFCNVLASVFHMCNTAVKFELPTICTSLREIECSITPIPSALSIFISLLSNQSIFVKFIDILSFVSFICLDF